MRENLMDKIISFIFAVKLPPNSQINNQKKLIFSEKIDNNLTNTSLKRFNYQIHFGHQKLLHNTISASFISYLPILQLFLSLMFTSFKLMSAPAFTNSRIHSTFPLAAATCKALCDFNYKRKREKRERMERDNDPYLLFNTKDIILLRKVYQVFQLSLFLIFQSPFNSTHTPFEFCQFRLTLDAMMSQRVGRFPVSAAV